MKEQRVPLSTSARFEEPPATLAEPRSGVRSRKVSKRVRNRRRNLTAEDPVPLGRREAQPALLREALRNPPVDGGVLPTHALQAGKMVFEIGDEPNVSMAGEHLLNQARAAPPRTQDKAVARLLRHDVSRRQPVASCLLRGDDRRVT